ncbi:extracellular solute-binding protein [Paenibacillus sp. 453mf]|uniref:extracellular solute-binding protein n=1 Tax=Paenibacillus sp. 453mf TaxID=1761874 RepID=UPI0008E1F140|nr:extracellular solute-binding protein [Paenibacillus sp. 453mf]SFS53457.1 putative aldouronate transport system substrate-binding protein [Paenibacillus sp. 453mf]
MKKVKRLLSGACILSLSTTLLLAGCGTSDHGSAAVDGDGPFPISMAIVQVGEIPESGDVEKAIEEYTNTDLSIQWVPSSAYDEKVSVMIASNEMPMIMKLNYVPIVISALQSSLFWELGPYIDDYPNLKAQDPNHYNNISVEGKIYGIPLFRDMGRASYNYRSDWLETLGMELPDNLEEWYELQKAMVEKDPDGNGKDDTYGFVLDKGYNTGHSAVTTRLAVSIGGVNKWGLVDDKITPEFMTSQYVDVLDMFRRMYAEGLINQDFAVMDGTETGKLFDSGRAGLGNAVAQALKSQYERLTATDPSYVVDNAAWTGPEGIRLAGEPGHNGFLAIPKQAVKSEEELKRVLEFMNALLDESSSTLLMRGVKDVHYKETEDGRTEFIDFALFQQQVKPYRDNLLNIEGYHVKPLKDTPQGEKGTAMAKENAKYVVPNISLTLTSATYMERGNELDLLISDAQTKYIMGQIDEAGWQAEVDKWLKAGGSQVIEEFQASYDAK